MSIIKYFDIDSKVIDQKATLLLTDYYKVYLDSANDFKYTEAYGKTGIEYIEYYLGSHETVDEVFELFPKYERITFYTKREKKGTYSKYERLVIDKSKNILGKRIQVYGDLLLPIYDRALEITTNRTLHFDKSYWDLERDLHYEFEYEETTGDFKQLTIYDPTQYFDVDDHTLYPNMIGNGKNPFGFDWHGFTYYRKAEPVIPDE